MRFLNPLLRLSALSLLCSPAVLSAQSLPPGASVTGTLEMSYSSDSNDDLTLFYGDVDGRFSLSGGGEGLGFDLGLTTYQGNDTFHDLALYGALTYTTSYGKFSIGLPRNASSGLSRMPLIGGSRALGYAQQAYLGDLPQLGYLAADEEFYGLRYDGDYGALKAAVSVHHFCCSGGDFADVAVKYDSGFFFANGSLQYYDPKNAPNATVLHGEAGAATDFYEAGLGLTSGDTILPDAWQAWATYRPIDQVGVSATMLDAEGASALWGLSAKYGFAQGGYVQAGIADSKNTDALWDVSLGFKF